MHTTTAEEMSCLLRDCVEQLSAVEAAFVEECHLSDPRKPLGVFKEEHGLSQREMAELRVRAVEHVREKLAAKNIHRLTDIL
ncbi:MAG TPA: hypothetical protein VGK29_22710 [Paludibaculum sp.]|jgi:hypothetical protein